jgi:hypothetical protein
VPANYRPRVFRVTVDDVFVHKSQDIGDGEYRLFVEVGGDWILVNEIPEVDNVLDDGLQFHCSMIAHRADDRNGGWKQRVGEAAVVPRGVGTASFAVCPLPRHSTPFNRTGFYTR